MEAGPTESAAPSTVAMTSRQADVSRGKRFVEVVVEAYCCLFLLSEWKFAAREALLPTTLSQFPAETALIRSFRPVTRA